MTTPTLSTSLLDRVRQDRPHWADTVILPWDQNRFDTVKSFTVSKYWCNQGSINMFRVVGTQHPDYIGLSWCEFLERGKRMRENLRLHTANRHYYLETVVKQPIMYYESLDGTDYYVAGDGNHRTCIARFDFHEHGLSMLHGVNVTDYRIDWSFVETYDRLQEVVRERRLALYAEAVTERTGREDTAGWMLESYCPGIRVRFDGADTVLNAEEAQRYLQVIETPRWRRWFVRGGT